MIKKDFDPYNNSFYEMKKSKSIEINDLEEAKIIESIIKFKKMTKLIGQEAHCILKKISIM